MDRVKDGVGSLSLADRSLVICDIRVGGGIVMDENVVLVSTALVILEANAAGELSEVLVVVGIEGGAKVAATGHGSKALGVGSAEGKGYSIIVVFPCNRAGLTVLPEGDHMKAIFTP